MASEQVVGTAKIVVDVDSSGVEAGTNRAKDSVKSLGTATEQAADVATKAYTRQEQALRRQIDTLNLDAEGKLRYRIATQATAQNVAELTKALDDHIAAQKAAAAATEEGNRAAQGGSQQRKLVITENQGIEESERSLAERRRLGNQVLNDSTKGTTNWAKEQANANARAAEMQATQAKGVAPAQAAARATAEQQQALEKLVHSIDPTVKALDDLDRKERQLASLRQQGLVSTADYDNLAGKLRDQRVLIGGVGEAMNRGGMSARQYNAALRGLPAQFTDIAVSLQAGQAPLTVFLQQGGQLKDMFGGIGPAAKAMGGYVLGLINPLTVTAAAVTALGVGAYQGSLEMGRLERSLISSGNAAGVTAAGMNEMAASLDNITGVTQGKAVDALAAVAATGAFTGEQMQMVATASLQWSVATGAAVDDTVASFSKLADDPVRALLDLNKQMGFLTEESLKVVQQLVDQGRHTEAVTEAIKLMADTLKNRSGEMVENTGYLEKAWKAVGNAVKETWDAIKSVGRDKTLQDQINQLESNIALWEGGYDVPGKRRKTQEERRAYIASLREQVAELQKAQQGATATNVENGQSAEARRALAANYAFEQSITREMNSQLTLQERINKMRDDALKAGVTNYDLIDQREAQMREAEKRRADKKAANAGDGGLGSATLARIKAEADAEKASVAATTKELQAQYAAREVSANDYYSRMRDLTQQQTAVEEASILKQIEAVRNQTGKRKESGVAAQQIAALEAQLSKVREEGASKVRVLTTEEDKAAKKRADGLKAYREAMAAQSETLAAQMQAMVDRERMSSRDFELQSKINEVLAQQAQELRNIAAEQDRGSLDKGDADARRDALRTRVREDIATIRAGYAEADAVRLDFNAGVERGMQEFMSSSMDVAGQVATAMSNAFGGMADAIVQFTQTGKLSFSDLARSIMADLTRIAVKIAMTKALESMFGSGMSGSGTNVSASTAGSNKKGYSSGGYTGPGGKYEERGTVHAGEVVFSQEDVARSGGVAAVERMRLGGAGSSPIASGGFGAAAAGKMPSVSINFIGGSERPKERRESMVDGQLQIDMIMEQVDGYMAEGISNGTSRTAMALGRGG